MANEEMTLEERVQFLEVLAQSMLFAPEFEKSGYQREIAADLYTLIEKSEASGCFPPAVRSALLLRADQLAGLDNTPDALRPALRHLPLPKPTGA